MTNHLARILDDALVIISAQASALQQIQALHQPIDHIYGKTSCKICGTDYPCKTMQIIAESMNNNEEPCKHENVDCGDKYDECRECGAKFRCPTWEL